MSDDDLRLYEGDVVHLGNGLGTYEFVEARHRRTKPDRYHCQQISGDGVVWWGPHHLTDVLEHDDARLVRADERGEADSAGDDSPPDSRFMSSLTDGEAISDI